MFKISLLIFLLSFFSSQAFSKLVVYGSDDRKEPFEASLSYEELAKSTLGRVSRDLLKFEEKNVILPETPTLGKMFRLCESERFVRQNVLTDCSGFLIASDVLVTAGHCVPDRFSCSEDVWILDYKLSPFGEVPKKLPRENIFSCKEIIAYTFGGKDQNDFALIRLDHASNRTPLKIREQGKVEDLDELVVIGHPSGLPTKITEGGTLRKNDDPIFFMANLDTFSGNSGSAVFSARTGVVEGILVRGENDYKYDHQKGCAVVNTCKEGECRGEDITRITNILPYLDKEFK